MDFHLAMSGENAKNMYEELLKELRSQYGSTEKIKDGQFGKLYSFYKYIFKVIPDSVTIIKISILLDTGAMMEVNIANDGPVTIELESKNDNIDHSNS